VDPHIEEEARNGCGQAPLGATIGPSTKKEEMQLDRPKQTVVVEPTSMSLSELAAVCRKRGLIVV